MVNDENRKKVKNILFLFLSDFKLNSELTGLAPEKIYHGKNNYSVKARQTNETAVYYVNHKCKERDGQGLDKIFMFASSMVRSKSPYNNPRCTILNKPKTTHLEYFKEDVREKVDNAKSDNFFAQIDYEESEPEVAKGDSGTEDWYYDKNENDFNAACDMAKMIQTYCKYPDKKIENKDDVDAIWSGLDNEKSNEKYKVRLYVDMTGGLRHSNMLMLAVIDLLKYSDIEICDVIYTNYQKCKVEEATNIYNVFQLVSGVEEFTNYGSVKILDKYFEDVISKLEKQNSKQKISKELENLIKSMNNISETLKFCRSGMIEKNMKDLKKNIDEYIELKEPEEKFTEEEKVFRVLLSTIGDKYKNIFDRKDKSRINIISVIRWCMNNEFYQQALTFFTEMVPKYIVQKKIIYTDYTEKEIKDIIGGTDYESWQKTLIRKYMPRNEFTDIKWMLGNHIKNKDKYKKFDFDELEKKINRLEKYIIFYSDYTLETIKEHNFLKDTLYKLNTCQDKEIKSVYYEIKALEKDEINDNLGTSFNSYEVDNLPTAFENAAATRRVRIERMLEKEFIRTDCDGIKLEYDKQDALDIICRYNEICELRNMINHANSDKNSELTNTIRTKLNEIITILENFDDKLYNNKNK